MSLVNTKVFSGEPLPVQPPESNPDRASFDRKLLDYLRRLVAKVAEVSVAGNPVDATYWTKINETATFPSSRMVIAGSNITLDYTTPGQVTVSASGGGSGVPESFASKLDGDTDVVSQDGAGAPTPFSIPWNKALHFNTSTFTHDDATNPDEIGIVTDGVYQIHVDLTHDDKFGLDMWVELKYSGSWYKVVYSVLANLPPTGAVSETKHFSNPVVLKAGTKIRIRGLDQTGNLVPGLTFRFYEIGTRISVIKIGSVINGGTGGGLGWDANPPTWTTPAP